MEYEAEAALSAWLSDHGYNTAAITSDSAGAVYYLRDDHLLRPALMQIDRLTRAPSEVGQTERRRIRVGYSELNDIVAPWLRIEISIEQFVVCIGKAVAVARQG